MSRDFELPTPWSDKMTDTTLGTLTEEMLKELPAIRDYYRGSSLTTVERDINQLCDAVESLAEQLSQKPARKVSLISAEELKGMLLRANFAAQVTLPIDKFRDLCFQAMRDTQ